MPESLPGCIGYYGAPIAPNGPCETCEVRDICKKNSPAKKVIDNHL